MFGWLTRLLEPQVDAQDLGPSAPRPPPVPPADLTIDDLRNCRRGDAQAHPASDVEDPLVGPLFAYFRANPEELPAFPALAIQIFRILERPTQDVDVDGLVRVIGRDPATSALVLRVGNSSRFGGAQRINTVRDAVVRLGVQEVSNLAVAAASKALFDSQQRVQIEQFSTFWAHRWRHALTTAFSASWLSMECRCGNPQQAFLGGLLHDVGKSLALRALSQLVIDGKAQMPTRADRVEALLEAVHIDIGDEASVSWGLPGFVVGVCQDHHQEDAGGLPAVVAFASDLYELRFNGYQRSTLTDELLGRAERLDIDQRRFDRFVCEQSSFLDVSDEVTGP